MSSEPAIQLKVELDGTELRELSAGATTGCLDRFF